MEKQVKNNDFDFSKHIEKSLEVKEFISASTKKNLKYMSFLIVGSLAMGAGFGAITNFSQGYLVDKEKNANIAQIEAQNEQIRKNLLNQISLKKQALQDEIEVKEQAKQRQVRDKVILEKQKVQYDILLSNKDSIIENYEAQLFIYDIAYKENIEAVKKGLISLDELNEVRSFYQEYKNDIHGYIKFVHETTISFDSYTQLGEEGEKLMKDVLNSYQGGGLNRSTNLENALIVHVADDSKDGDDQNFAMLRRDAKNKIIDDLADIVSNDNATTKIKKLKR